MDDVDGDCAQVDHMVGQALGNMGIFDQAHEVQTHA